MTPPSAPLSVAIDASLWDEPTTGIGLYTRCLVGALQAQGVEVDRVGARSSGEAPRGPVGRTAYFLGQLPATLRDLRPTLFHGVSNFTLPLQRMPGTRMVLTVHDLIPVLLPDTVSRAYRWQFRLWLERSLTVTDRIICVSERTRADLLEHFRPDPARVSVIPLGVDHVDQVPAPDATGRDYLRTLGLPKEFVLYAGSLDARKNVSVLLDACERLQARGTPITLVLVGQSWFGSRLVERRIAQMRSRGHDIRPLGYQTDALFYELIRRACVFVFPSQYEGFGLPPLEAMHLGVPAVIAATGAMPEVCGDAAVQVGPRDAEALAEALARLLKSPEERWARAEAGEARAAHFTWARTATQTMAVYRQALDGDATGA